MLRPCLRAMWPMSVSFLDSDLVGTIGGVLGMWHNHPTATSRRPTMTSPPRSACATGVASRSS